MLTQSYILKNTIKRLTHENFDIRKRALESIWQLSNWFRGEQRQKMIGWGIIDKLAPMWD